MSLKTPSWRTHLALTCSWSPEVGWRVASHSRAGLQVKEVSISSKEQQQEQEQEKRSRSRARIKLGVWARAWTIARVQMVPNWMSIQMTCFTTGRAGGCLAIWPAAHLIIIIWEASFYWFYWPSVSTPPPRLFHLGIVLFFILYFKGSCPTSASSSLEMYNKFSLLLLSRSFPACCLTCGCTSPHHGHNTGCLPLLLPTDIGIACPTSLGRAISFQPQESWLNKVFFEGAPPVNG